MICSNRDISPISQSDQFPELRMDLTIVSRLCRSQESLTVPQPSSTRTPFWGNSLIHLSKLRGRSNLSQSKMIDQLRYSISSRCARREQGEGGGGGEILIRNFARASLSLDALLTREWEIMGINEICVCVCILAAELDFDGIILLII